MQIGLVSRPIGLSLSGPQLRQDGTFFKKLQRANGRALTNSLHWQLDSSVLNLKFAIVWTHCVANFGSLEGDWRWDEFWLLSS